MQNSLSFHHIHQKDRLVITIHKITLVIHVSVLCFSSLLLLLHFTHPVGFSTIGLMVLKAT